MENKGTWKTINGARVLIEDGQSISEAFNEAFNKQSHNLETIAQTFAKALNRHKFKTEVEHDEKDRLTVVNIRNSRYKQLGMIYFHNQNGNFKTDLEVNNKNRRVVQQILDVTNEIGLSHGYSIDYPDDFY